MLVTWKTIKELHPQVLSVLGRSKYNTMFGYQYSLLTIRALTLQMEVLAYPMANS